MAGVAEPGQRRQVQDLLAKACVGSNPTPRINIALIAKLKRILMLFSAGMSEGLELKSCPKSFSWALIGLMLLKRR